MLLTSEAHKRSEQTRSSSYLHANSPDTCTVKNACEFTTCYPENLLSYLAHAHAVDTRPSFLREGLGTRLVLTLPSDFLHSQHAIVMTLWIGSIGGLACLELTALDPHSQHAIVMTLWIGRWVGFAGGTLPLFPAPPP